MPLSDHDAAPLDGDGDDEGKSGSGDFGRPELKPSLEALLEPHSKEEGRGESGEGSSGSAAVENFGHWELHEGSLMLFHRQHKKRLMLEQLNAPSKVMRVVVALATQPGEPGQWDIEGLLKALDAVAKRRFSKGLYQLASMSSDTAKLDWRRGTVAEREGRRPKDNSAP